MIIPPSLLRIRVIEKGKRKVNLWIPLFLIWPLVIALMVVLAPVALVVCLVWPKGRQVVMAGPRLLALAWAIRGLRVRVKDEANRVRVEFV